MQTSVEIPKGGAPNIIKGRELSYSVRRSGVLSLFYIIL